MFASSHESFTAILTIFTIFTILRLTSAFQLDDSLTYVWPLPSNFTSGDRTLSVNPDLSLSIIGDGGNSTIIKSAFERYKKIIFKHSVTIPVFQRFGFKRSVFDISVLKIAVQSGSEELQLGVDESYTLFVDKSDAQSIIGKATIEANTVYGALRGLETFSQLCTFDYGTKSVQVYKAPWYIQDKPRFAYRGLLLDTSRHYLPIDIIKQIIESMSYAKLNVLHWHIIDEESFPLEVPSYPKLWKGSYTKWERYTVEDAYDIVNFAKLRGINVMAEIDVPGHAESWGTGYPDLWPSATCREPLDVAKNFTFDVISGILTDMRKIFPFGLFHLGGDEVNTVIQVGFDRLLELNSTCEAMKLENNRIQWFIGGVHGKSHQTDRLQDQNLTARDAYQYFVLRVQEIAISKGWTPVNWEETFNAFASNLDPRTIVHNWLGGGVCPKAVAKGFRCIFSNQGFWYLDHLDVPWDDVYKAEPLEGINNASEEELVLGGQVCMWAETADTSVIQQTIWPRAAAAAERLWSTREATSSRNITLTALPRLHYFRCLLNRRGVQAAPVTNYFARRPPTGPGSCYEQ